jgi:type I restriction enzyme S subunit
VKAGWQIKPLGELCDILDNRRKPVTKSDRIAGPYPYYGATGIQDFVSDFIFDEPLVLVGEDGAKWESGENTAFPIEGKCWVNNHAHVLRPIRERLLDNWLIHFLNHSDLTEYVSGLTVPKLNQGSLREIRIPLAPIEEQHRIVTLLDEAFADIATAKANAEKNLQNVREVFETHLRNLLNARVVDGIDTTLHKCCDQIFAGGDVPKDRVSNERTATYPVPIFSNGAKDDGLYGFTDTARVTKPSVTVSARGTLGFSAIRNEPFLPVVRLIVLTPNENLIDLCFLHYTVLGMDFENTGTSIPQLTVPNFKDLSIYLPPLAKQKEFVLALDSIRDEIQNLESIYLQKLTALDDLKKSLLHQAFSGLL